jgi:hypothetical protein
MPHIQEMETGPLQLRPEQAKISKNLSPNLIPARFQETGFQVSPFKASPGKISLRFCLKNKQAKGAYNPGSSGGRDQDDHSSRPTQVKKLTELHLNQQSQAW